MSTFLQLTNRAIRRFNEVELDAGTWAAAVGFQSFCKDAINDAVRDIIHAELEWPFNVATNTETLKRGQAEYSLVTGFRSVDWDSFFVYSTDLITNGNFATDITSWTDISSGTGTAAHTTDGDGRLRLAGGASGVGAVTQSISTIGNTTYRISFRVYSGTVNLNLGTTSGGTEISSEAFAEDKQGEGTYFSTDFIASGSTTFVSFSHAANASYDIDTVAVVDIVGPQYLHHRDIDHYNQFYREKDFVLDPSVFNTPEFVFPTIDDGFYLSPVPNTEYSLEYKYHTIPAEMSADTDTTTIPERYEHVIIDRAMFYIFMFREDAESATIMDSRSMDKVERMRIELINKPARMFSGANTRSNWYGQVSRYSS